MSNHSETIIAFTRLQRSFHNHLLHFMVFFIITGLPLLSTSFSFLGSLFAIPYDFIGSVYTDLSTSGLTDNERLAAGLQFARIIHRLTALLFLIMATIDVFSRVSALFVVGVQKKVVVRYLVQLLILLAHFLMEFSLFLFVADYGIV